MGLREKYSSDNPANRVRPRWVFTYQHPAHMLALFLRRLGKPKNK